MKYRVYVFEGHNLSALEDDYVPALTFDRLTWEESVELCRVSFMQGYGCILWQIEGGGSNG